MRLSACIGIDQSPIPGNISGEFEDLAVVDVVHHRSCSGEP
jgi:hypothetical protein